MAILRQESPQDSCGSFDQVTTERMDAARPSTEVFSRRGHLLLPLLELGWQPPSFGFKDGQIDRGTGLNPCTIGHVDNCTGIQGQKISPTPTSKAKVVVIATSDMTLMDSLIPFCG